MSIPEPTLEGFKKFIEEHENLVKENKLLQIKIAELSRYVIAIHSINETLQKLELKSDLPLKSQQHPMFGQSTDMLELSCPSYNAIKNAGVTLIGELVRKTEADLMKPRVLGRKSINEIKEVLAGIGLHLGMTEEEIRNFNH
ncbi:MAG: hypothetical protein KGJ13_00485 [Patescibacteria group bacterium]|nr:hypothetical protein [Patescibacteria group bacterium]